MILVYVVTFWIFAEYVAHSHLVDTKDRWTRHGSQEDTMFTLNAKIGRIVLMYFDNDFVLAIGTTKTK